MSYFNLAFAFLIVPIVVVLYNIVPKKVRPFILLGASCIFYYLSSANLIIFLLMSIVSIYLTGLKMSNIDEELAKKLDETAKEDKKVLKEKYKKKKKMMLVFCILFNVSFLFFFKYLKFFTININEILNFLNIEYQFKIMKFLAPIGISFYTLQALSYIIDIYNGKTKADKNFFRVATFMAFFPTIIEGPIGRYEDTADSLYNGSKVTYQTFCFGYQRILYGFFKKFIIADRLNILVKTVFECYQEYSGLSIILGAIGYTVMLYMEFSGTMDVVIGTGEIFNVKIKENFRQPFFAKNISEFWTRWHISLGAWFKDYIFYPVSLSKPMKRLTISARKKLGNHYGPLISGAVALLVVWLLNGLWHGAGWNFIFYGLYMFVLILLGNIFNPIFKNLCSKLNINQNALTYRIFQSLKMTIFVFIGELFFRAPTLTIGLQMFGKIFSAINIKSGELMSLGLDIKDYIILFVAGIVIFIISILKEKGINIREKISQQNIALRWALYYSLILSIIIFGAYGTGYIPVDPIYADF